MYRLAAQAAALPVQDHTPCYSIAFCNPEFDFHQTQSQHQLRLITSSTDFTAGIDVQAPAYLCYMRESCQVSCQEL